MFDTSDHNLSAITFKNNFNW